MVAAVRCGIYFDVEDGDLLSHTTRAPVNERDVEEGVPEATRTEVGGN